MTVQVYMDVRTHRLGDDLTSPELVLVDPELGAIARARLPDTAPVDVVGRPPMPIRAPALVSGSRQTPPGALPSLFVRARAIPWMPVSAVVTASLLLFVGVHADGSRRVDVAAPVPVVSARVPTGTANSPSGRPVERRFVWARTPGASGYHVEFFRGPRRVFVRETTEPEVVVSTYWTFAGRHLSLRAGKYAWYVWPVVDGRRASGATVQATVSIPGS